MLYFGFLAENIFVHQFKCSFSRWRVEHYEILPVMNTTNVLSELTSCIQQKIKTLNVSSVMENSPKMNEEKFELSISAIVCGSTWTVHQQKT